MPLALSKGQRRIDFPGPGRHFCLQTQPFHVILLINSYVTNSFAGGAGSGEPSLAKIPEGSHGTNE
ncbi:hypothetical protein PSAB_08070 [Paenibacillus sabinae T27]|uniref:Uncharacterized protein n=1 Tax=Paenibacillus sabinae T27 TaxID=1268072 RepID=X4ZA51_9BACL|nr:hypothetical protein PSAB_08070 [Paenibacillus sabinae T27]